MKRKYIYAGIVVLCTAYLGVTGWFLATRTARIAAIEPPKVKWAKPPAETGEWNTYHGDSALCGIADAAFPDTLEVLWRLKTRAAVEQPPVVCNGRLIVATARGEIIAATLDGQECWARELFTGAIANGAPVRRRIGAPIACFNDIVYAGCDEGFLIALEAASGRDRWQLKLAGPVRGAPNGANGSVFVLDHAEGALVCVDGQSGAVLGRGEGVGRSDASPSVAPEAAVYGSCASAVHICSPENAKRLRDIQLDADSQVAGGAAISNGHVISGCRSGRVFEADIATGTILWTNDQSRAEVFSTPAVNAEWVIVSSNDGFVYALDRSTGKSRWSYDTKGMPLSPVVAGDKVIVPVDGELFLLRLADGAKVWSLKIGGQITEAAVTRHRIYVGSEEGVVVALGAGNK